MVARYTGRTSNVCDLVRRVDLFCVSKPEGNAILRIPRSTKRTWTGQYLKRLKMQGQRVAEGLSPPKYKRRGSKPVFTPEVHDVYVFVCMHVCVRLSSFTMLMLIPLNRHHPYSYQVEEDVSTTIQAYLSTLEVGQDVHCIVAYLKGVLESKCKPHWNACITEYNRGRAKRFKPNHEWMRLQLHKWGLTPRAGTTVARKLPPNVEEVHELFIDRLAFLLRHDLPSGVTMVTEGGERVPVTMIPPELVVNCDQGGIPPIAFSNSTWAKVGVKDVPLAGLDDKRQMTAVLGSSATGKPLPLQVVMKGESDR